MSYIVSKTTSVFPCSFVVSNVKVTSALPSDASAVKVVSAVTPIGSPLALSIMVPFTT